MSHPVFEIVTTTQGVKSIRNKIVDEIMHNPVGPWREANALYIEQSNLRARLQSSGVEPLVVFDVGLGAAANALATLHCFRSARAGGRRNLQLLSFEKDLELLEFALEHAHEFAHFSGFETALKTLLATGEWREDGLEWKLYPGDFLSTLSQVEARPHLIYFDPYSPKVNTEMWTVDSFKRLRGCSRVGESEGTILYTYSQATPIRAALLLAGFFVGHGVPSPPKEETTQAATRLEDLPRPLGAVWLKRWQSSHMQMPLECKASDAEWVRQAILAHPQFA